MDNTILYFYLLGCIIAFGLTIYYKCLNREITIGDIFLIVLFSVLSWITVAFSLLILLIASADTVIWKKKSNTN